jgi:hypothetical protein
MLRAILVSIGLGLILVWIVALVDRSTWWMTWLVGIAGWLTCGDAALVKNEMGPIGASMGSVLIGSGLMALFIVGLATGATAWLTWFTFAFACGLFGAAGFAILLRGLAPRPYGRTPLSRH